MHKWGNPQFDRYFVASDYSTTTAGIVCTRPSGVLILISDLELVLEMVLGGIASCCTIVCVGEGGARGEGGREDSGDVVMRWRTEGG